MGTPRTFDTIAIIFNPNSTGDAPALAEQLKASLSGLLPYASDIRLQPTSHAGHAVQLAREVAATGHVLVVSVSGDGGYNEVVNGVMQAGNPDAVCAVLAAGNANDHSRSTGTGPLEHAIAGGDVRHIDLLRITTGQPGDAPDEYAHSYIGFGLTPIMAIGLEKGSKGALKETVSVVRTFAKFKPFEILPTAASGGSSTAWSWRTSPRWPSTPPSATPTASWRTASSRWWSSPTSPSCRCCSPRSAQPPRGWGTSPASAATGSPPLSPSRTRSMVR